MLRVALFSLLLLLGCVDDVLEGFPAPGRCAAELQPFGFVLQTGNTFSGTVTVSHDRRGDDGLVVFTEEAERPRWVVLEDIAGIWLDRLPEGARLSMQAPLGSGESHFSGLTVLYEADGSFLGALLFGPADWMQHPEVVAAGLELSWGPPCAAPPGRGEDNLRVPGLDRPVTTRFAGQEVTLYPGETGVIEVEGRRYEVALSMSQDGISWSSGFERFVNWSFFRID